jgi:arylsulfatase A-like enzyme/Flp pilus assembly protein TadD
MKGFLYRRSLLGRSLLLVGLVGLVGVSGLLGCGGRDGGGGSEAEPSGASGRASSEPAESVILITIDTLRADALGFTGNEDVETPALDRLASGGRVFTHAHAHNVVTLPSHANILTGLHPYEHGVRNNGGFVLGDDVPTLATALAAEGFATGAVVGAFPVDSRFGLDSGFDLYDDDFGEGGGLFSYSERPGTEVVERGLRWWSEHAGERRFLWLHLFDPHAPYEPPSPYDERGATPYLGEVAAVDGALEPLLDRLLEGTDGSGADGSTAVVFTSDHGESLGAHGERTHGFFAYEPTLAVPLVLWGPGVEPGSDDRPARHVDIAPTVFELLGLLEMVPIEGLPGRSLLKPPSASPTAEGSPAAADTYFESMSPNLEYGAAPLRGVIRDGVKLIDLPIPELYDLESDPEERENVIQERRPTARALRGALPEESAAPVRAGELSAEETERLRALGYLGSTASGTAGKESYGPEDDPKRLADLPRKVDDMTREFYAGRTDEAVRLGREILERRPTLTIAYEYLGKILLQRNRLDEALALFRQAEEAGAANDAIRQQLGLTLVQAGRPEEAVTVLERVDPDATDADTLSSLGLALASLGRMSEAADALERAVARDPESARAHEVLSFIALQRGEPESAREHALEALEIDGRRPDAWNNLAIAEYQLGRPEQAVEGWKRAANLAPGNLDVLFNLGLVAAEVGDAETARKALRRFLSGAPPAAYGAERRQAEELLGRLDRGP